MRASQCYVILFLFTVLAPVPVSYAASDAVKAGALLAQMQIRSQELPLIAKDCVGGDIDAFRNLADARDEINQILVRLKHDDPGLGMRGATNSTAQLRKDFTDVDAAWAKLSLDVTKVLHGQEQVLASAAAIDNFVGKTALLNARTDEALKILAEGTGTKIQVLVVSRQMLLIDRMQRRAHSIAGGGEDSESAAQGLERGMHFYSVVLAALIKGNPDLNIEAMAKSPARDILNDISNKWRELTPSVTKLIATAPDLQATRQAGDEIRPDSQSLRLKASSMSGHLIE